jgi:hypothetical protein
MTFPDSDALAGAINNLKEIIRRSQSENDESVVLLSKIEAIVSDIERKSKSTQRQTFVAPVAVAAVTPVGV